MRLWQSGDLRQQPLFGGLARADEGLFEAGDFAVGRRDRCRYALLVDF